MAARGRSAVTGGHSHIATNKARGDDTLHIRSKYSQVGPAPDKRMADTRDGESCVCWAGLTHIVTSRQMPSVASKALLSFKQIILTSNMKCKL